MGASTEVVTRDLAPRALPGEQRVLEAAERSLTGRRRGLRRIWPFLGPAFVAAVAYVDPGNFATNIAGGAKFGYMLLWVILASNLMAMLIQTLSAKLGIATGLNLPEVCRARFSRRSSIGLWIQAEAIAMATDLAEFIGAALGLNLLFGIPLLPAAFIVGAIAFGILALQTYGGFRHLEAVIVGLVGVILVGFAFNVVLAHPAGSGIASGFVPHLAGTESLLISVGILGATVMPHVIYLHSALTQRRSDRQDGGRAPEDLQVRAHRRADRDVDRRSDQHEHADHGRRRLPQSRPDRLRRHRKGLPRPGVDRRLACQHLLRARAARLGPLVLLVGTMAGQVVMQGFIRRQIPLFLRRAITMVPAIVVIAIGVNATSALIISQVFLSFGIPFALIPLVYFTRDRTLMGGLVNHRLTTIAAGVVAAIIVVLNVFLLYQTFTG